MAFMIHSTADGRVPSNEYLPCGAITPKVGTALVMTDGKLALATAGNAPAYISMIEKSEACKAGEIIPVIRVLPDIIFGTTWSAAATAVKLGEKVTLSADGSQVTATTASGVAEIVSIQGTGVGDACLVRFP